jgi:hypothetical protein
MKTKNKIQAGLSIGMIRLALASFFIAIVFASCSKDEIAPSSSNNVSSDASVLRAVQPVNTIQLKEENISLQILPIQPPFIIMSRNGQGNNPSWEVKVFANGLVSLKAIANLSFKGTIEYAIPATTVNALRELFLRNGFERLKDEYPGSGNFPVNVTAFVSCQDCDNQFHLSIEKVTDHSAMLPANLIKIKATAAQLLHLDKFIQTGSDTASEVDGGIAD